MPIQPYSAGDLDRLRSVQARPKGWTHATHDQVLERKGKDGHWRKLITDQLGNEVTMRWDGQDVTINLPVLRIQTRAVEIR